MKNHIVMIILDSCRFDSYQMAATPNMDRLGMAEKRYAYASWTAPSHYAFMMGLLPHKSVPHVYASEVYKREFSLWAQRTGSTKLDFMDFLPELSLTKVLKKMGYQAVARVSLPVINEHTLIRKYFDDYKLMDKHDDFKAMVEEVVFPDAQPHFYFLNVGETHYPYMLKDAGLPILSGVHGVFKSLGGKGREQGAAADAFFDPEMMKRLHRQQSLCVEYIDAQVGILMDKAPPNTYFIITSDHGELFGEDGYFGHGPIMHEKCFEVPFVEGLGHNRQ